MAERVSDETLRGWVADASGTWHLSDELADGLFRELLAARAVVEAAREVLTEAEAALRWYRSTQRVAKHPDLTPSVAQRLARTLDGPLAAYDETGSDRG